VNAVGSGSRSPGPFFELTADWLPTGQQLTDAGLPGGQLAAVTLDLVQISPAGKWHPVTASAQVRPCARVRRATDAGRELTRRQAGLLTGLELCRACTAQVQLSGRAGTYLAIARHIVAARAWTQAFEEAAVSADWAACARWAARTPFDDETVLALLDALDGSSRWEPGRRAATIAWQHLWDRADAAQIRARLAAGPPGLRAHAAAACALAAAQQDAVLENELIAAISATPQWRNQPVPAPGWGAASRAWAQTLCLDADPAAARTALADAVEQLYSGAQVRDLALLPPMPACRGEEFTSLADWAHAEYRAVRLAVACRWYRRLETALAEVQEEAEEVTGRWRLLLVIGWPPVADRDRELAYLAHYPELIRTPQVPACGDDPGCPSRAIVLLHVPGFAARHAAAAAHQSRNLTATVGAEVAAGMAPSPDQVCALFRYAAALHGGRDLTEAGRLGRAGHDNRAGNR
jgi:hypothetical protein